MTVSAASVPAAAQSLSEQLAQRIEQAREAERSRNFDTALQIYERTIRQDGLTPTATRTLLKNRSQLFEVILMFDRAEADLTKRSGSPRTTQPLMLTAAISTCGAAATTMR